MKLLRAIVYLVDIASGASVLLSSIPAFLAGQGFDVGPFFGWFAANSVWLLPISCFALGLTLGFAGGWKTKGANDVKEVSGLDPVEERDPFISKRRLRRREREQITEALSCSTWINTKMIGDLYFDDLRFTKEDMAAAHDPLVEQYIVYTAPVEMDGVTFYRICLRPGYRSLFAKHEDYFFDEIERLCHGRVEVDRKGRTGCKLVGG